MRIVAIRDIVSPIRSNIANAYIDFSQMTASVVAVGPKRPGTFSSVNAVTQAP